LIGSGSQPIRAVVVYTIAPTMVFMPSWHLRYVNFEGCGICLAIDPFFYWSVHISPLHKIKDINCYKSLACNNWQYSTQVGADISAWIYQRGLFSGNFQIPCGLEFRWRWSWLHPTPFGRICFHVGCSSDGHCNHCA
jgi:hypothetical protein